MLEKPQNNILEKIQQSLVELEDITERLNELNRMEESHLKDYSDQTISNRANQTDTSISALNKKQ